MTGVTIRVKFTNGNSASSPTININNTGAKSVYRFGSTAPVGDNSWETGAVVELTYDGTGFFMTGSDDIGALYNALDNKQPKTDNTLETTNKTVSGAINEIKDELDGDAETLTGAVVTVSDAVPANCDLSVKVDPVQDLHGYSAPWVGGAGKNKVNPAEWSNSSNNGITFTVDKDNGEITISNTATANASAEYDLSNLLPNTQYILSGAPSTSSESSTYNLQVQPLSVKDIGNGVTFTTGNDVSNYKLRITVYEGVSGNNAIFKPMVRLSTESDDTWEPYSNICPISGSTETVVSRVGKNLFDPAQTNALHNKIINENGEVVTNEYWCVSDYVGIKSETSYSVKYTATNPGAYFYVAYYDSGFNFIQRNAVATIEGLSVKTVHFTTVSNVKYVRLVIPKADGTEHYNWSTVSMFEGNDVFPDAYAGETYTINLNGTVYGGTLDVKTGVLTVDRKYAEYTDGTGWQRASSDTGAWFFCYPTGCAANSINLITDKFVAAYAQTGVYNTAWINFNQLHIKPDANIAPSGSTAEGLEEFKTWLSNNHLQVVYPLATPFTVQLDPVHVQLLKGVNTIYASTGDISVTAQKVAGAIGELTTDKQDKTDYALETTAKTVVGGINELNTLANAIDARTFANNTPVFFAPNWRGGQNYNDIVLNKLEKLRCGFLLTKAGIFPFQTNTNGDGFIVDSGVSLTITNEGNNTYRFACAGEWYTTCLFMFLWDYR